MQEPRTLAKVLRGLARRYEAFHLTIGLLGNVLFFVGSLLFLSDNLKTPATIFFICGSLGMLIGNIGRALVDYQTRRDRTLSDSSS